MRHPTLLFICYVLLKHIGVKVVSLFLHGMSELNVCIVSFVDSIYPSKKWKNIRIIYLKNGTQEKYIVKVVLDV